MLISIEESVGVSSKYSSNVAVLTCLCFLCKSVQRCTISSLQGQQVAPTCSHSLLWHDKSPAACKVNANYHAKMQFITPHYSHLPLILHLIYKLPVCLNALHTQAKKSQDGCVSTRYKQVGNAVAPPMACALGRCLVLAAAGREHAPTNDHMVIPVRDPDMIYVSTLC